MDTMVVAAASVRNLIGQTKASLANLAKWTALASDQGAELILFPELNVSGYAPSPVAHQIAESIPGPSTDAVAEMAARHHVAIGMGLIERAADSFYCTHVLVNGAGIVGQQRKIHVPAQERPYWSAGEAIGTFDLGIATVGIAICRDAFFGEMTRTLYFKGAEIVLMPFGYYNVPRSQYLKETIHGMALIEASWSNGFYSVVCNSAEDRGASEWEPSGRKFPGWAGMISPWGRVLAFQDQEGNDECLVVQELASQELTERRGHVNFLAKELRPDLYRFQ